MEKVKNFFSKVWLFLKKHWISVTLILVAVIIGVFFVWDNIQRPAQEVKTNIFTPKPKETRVRAPLSGVLVEPDLAKKKPIAIVIENHPDARPQSGLNAASIVYETFAEGGITRFLAVFQEGQPQEIGPVRSARTYFVEWAESHKAYFAHVGGNIDALDMLQKLNAFDINQFYFGSYFWRDAKRYAPHNVYTTISKLTEAGKSKSYSVTDDNIQSFLFKDDIAKDLRVDVVPFTINFNANFAVTYTYNIADNNYLRSMSGVVQKDKNTGEQIKAKNVLVAFSDFSYGTTRIGEQKTTIRTTGVGNAVIFIDGKRTAGTWSRASKDKIMRFFDEKGAEVKLNAGTTWVEVAPVGTLVN